MLAVEAEAVKLEITDPRQGPDIRGPARWFLPLLRDERDLIFIRNALRMTAVIPPMAALIYWQFHWAFAVPYLAVVFAGFCGPYTLMLHATCHRPLFKKKYKALDVWIPWLLGPFFGMTPTSFFVHHIGMHHPENNMEDDLSSTLPYQRDKFTHFLHYWARFFFVGTFQLLRYLKDRKRTKLRNRLLKGELAWYGGVAVGLFLHWKATVVVFVLPFLLIRFFMMCGNFAQHAFVDVDDADNPYRNSTVLVNCPHNLHCYNDGYHIVHHVKPALHWTEMPSHFEDNRQRYIDDDAVIFEGLQNNQVVWWCLMTQNYDRLAEHVLQLGPNKRSHDELVVWLKGRVRRTSGTPGRISPWA